MKKKISNILIGLISVCLVIPFVFIIFYSRTSDLFTGLFIDAIVLGIIVVFYVTYCFVEIRKNYRISIAIIICLVIILFFFTYGIQFDAADYVFYKQREKKLNEFALEIKQYEKIKQMTDRKAYVKTLNDSLYEFAEKEVFDQYSQAVYLRKDLLEKLNVKEEVHNNFLEKLAENNFTSFETFKDGTISFTIGGMLDNCYGFAYSETGEHPMFNDCGKIIRWEKVSENWYAWGTT